MIKWLLHVYLGAIIALTSITYMDGDGFGFKLNLSAMIIIVITLVLINKKEKTDEL